MNRKKGKINFILAFVMCVLVSCYILVESKKQEIVWDDLTQFDTKVSISGESARPESDRREIQVAEDGTYRFYIKCKPDHEGLITGCIVYDEKGQEVFRCSGEEMEVESRELDLEAGNYVMEFCYIYNKDDWEDFWKASGEKGSTEEYAFLGSGGWNIHLEYGMEEVSGSGIENLLGVICGMIVALLFLKLLGWLSMKMGGRTEPFCTKDSYDERQLIARGKAYQAAFFTLLFYVIIGHLIDESFGLSLFASFSGTWAGICLSIMVFAVICILKDAYMSLYENAKGIIMIFGGTGILNVVIGIRIILKKDIILETGTSLNLMVGILCCVILIVFCGRLVYNKKHSDEEEEE